MIFLSDYPMYPLTYDFLYHLFGYFYCIKVTVDNNYRYNAISFGLVSD